MAATEGNHGSKGRGSQDEDENGFDLGWDLSSPTRTKNPYILFALSLLKK